LTFRHVNSSLPGARRLEPITIVHLSDVHLGNDFFWRSTVRGRWYRDTEDERLLKGLEAALGTIKPMYVVLSGDIVNKCRRANFKHAAQRLKEIFSGAGIDVKNRVLVIPGNHDVRLIPEDDEVFQRLKDFYYFLQDFFSEQTLRARKASFVKVDVGNKIAFYCLDSTLKEKMGVAEGEVGIAQRDKLLGKHEELKKLRLDFETFVKIAVVHHHPHPIEHGGRDQFMQMVDTGRVINLFQNLGANIVLHGHKHFPHQMMHYYDQGHHYVVLGAGTATCPVVREQSGEGNSFNVLKLYPDANLLEVQRWKASREKEFVAHFPAPLRFPLFKPSEKGYKMGEFRAITRVQNMAGTSTLTHKRLRVAVDRDGTTLQRIAFGMSSSGTGGEISGFDYDHGAIERVDYVIREKHRHEGHLVLREALKQGSAPVDFWCSYSMRGSLCMQRAEYAEFYPEKQGPPVESVDILVVHPCDLLTLVVEFPREFKVNARPLIEDANAEPVEMAHSFSHDFSDNTYILVVHKPKLGHQLRIVWEVP
jgi:predicted MPP superfamily phosphohydrolase